MSNNPYAAPSAVVAEVVENREEVRAIARGQRTIVWAVLGQWIASAVAQTTAQPFLSLLAMGAVLVCALMAIIGAVRLSRALGSHIVTQILVAILMIVPLVNLVTMLVLSMRATRALRKAGVRVGLLGAKVD